MMDAPGHADSLVSARLADDEEGRDMDTEIVVTGAIIDSWVEPARTPTDGSRLVLQVAPSGRPKEMMIVEAEASLVSDRGWLQDLGENLCHGSPVAAVGKLNFKGLFRATQLRLAR